MKRPKGIPLVAFLTCWAIALPPRIASAAATSLLLAPHDARVTPGEAEVGRDDMLQRTIDLEAQDAAVELEAAARQSGDPELFLAAARAYNRAARVSLDLELADMAVEQTYIALDILHFLASAPESAPWRPVAAGDVSALIKRADDYLKKNQEVVAAIKSRQEAEARKELEGEAPVSSPTSPVRSEIPQLGKALTVAGGVVLAFGIGGIGAGVAGLVLGGMSQSKVEEPTVHGDEFDDYDQRGKLGNTLAYVGLSIGGVLTAIAIPLLVLGKRRAKGKGRKAAWQLMPAPGGTGLAIRY